MDLDKLLIELAAEGVSDIHLRAGLPPLVRRDGALQPVSLPAVPAEDLGRFLAVLGFTGSEPVSDRSHAAGNALRFRVHAFRVQGLPALVLRAIPVEIPSLEDLGLPPAYRELCSLSRGIVLLGGERRSGKSTTFAALIQTLSATRSAHLVVIEEPIEHLYRDQLGSVSQIEVRSDAVSWEAAMDSALRSDAEVVALGALRGEPLLRRAVQAAEMGFLVLAVASGRTPGAVLQGLERDLESGPDGRRPLREALAAQLAAVCCQRLAPGPRRALLPLCAVLRPTAAVREGIAMGRLDVFEPLDLSYDQHILQRVEQGQIPLQAALDLSDDKAIFERRLHHEPAP